MVDLRVVSPDEWELWREVRLRALADAPEAFGSSVTDWEIADEHRWRQRLVSVPFNVVAVVDGVAVGQASGSRLFDRKLVGRTSMYVAPDARGSGTADALVEAVKEHARGLGATVVRLSVRRQNARAIKFYERVGFGHTDEPGDEPAEIAMLCPLST